MTRYPPTIIVVHPKERRSKCSVQHLRETPGFEFRNYGTVAAPVPAGEYVKLGMKGPLLSRKDIDQGLLILDGTWRWAERMEKDYQQISIRSLPSVQTAYPRASKTFKDPQGGLATIEALFIAYEILGRDSDILLTEYRWAEEFLARNDELLEKLARE